MMVLLDSNAPYVHACHDGKWMLWTLLGLSLSLSNLKITMTMFLGVKSGV